MNPIKSPHTELHKSHRAGWLRAAVLGADDGIVSTASLMLGVSAASGAPAATLTAGIAGLVAGALSMAVGEYVSVSSQKDADLADITIERNSIASHPKEEQAELAEIYERRGLSKELALQVAEALHAHGAVEAHARDELGITDQRAAKPLQAAFASALSFSIGAIIPILVTIIVQKNHTIASIAIVSLITLAVFGAVGARIGGGNKTKAALRVFIGGGSAMIITLLIGKLIGTNL